jgi:hypothetical protein
MAIFLYWLRLVMLVIHRVVSPAEIDYSASHQQ